MKAAMCIVGVLLASGPALRGEVVLLKGHHLGESVEEFLVAEPAIKEETAKCHSDEPRPYTAEEVHALSSFDIDSMGGRYPVWHQKRKQLEELARQGKLIHPEQRGEPQLHRCVLLAVALEGAASPNPGYVADISDRIMWRFDAGKLVYMNVRLQRGEFDEIVADMTKRVGSEPTLHSSEMFNAAGARWNDRDAQWVTPEIMVSIEEARNPSNPTLEVTLTSRALLEAETKRKAQSPSPLD